MHDESKVVTQNIAATQQKASQTTEEINTLRKEKSKGCSRSPSTNCVATCRKISLALCVVLPYTLTATIR